MKLNISSDMKAAAEESEEVVETPEVVETEKAVETPEVVETAKPPTKKRATRGKKKEQALSTFVEDGVSGDFGREDLETPYISMVQPGSEIHEAAPEALGKWIFDKSYVFGENIKCAVLGMTKRFQEVQDDDDDAMPKLFDTKEEAIAQGYADVRPIALIDLAIEVEEDSDDAEAASIFIDGKAYILARFFASGRSFGAARSIYTIKNMKKDPHTCYRFYNFNAKIKPARKKNFRVAVVSVGEETPQELRDVIAESQG